MTDRFDAIVLLGPTGSGKTPLGQVFEMRSWSGRQCAHFDFGENLRQVVASEQSDGIVSVDDIQFLRRVLESGALLEDEDFPIALRILRSFLARRRLDNTTMLVLNGLPRHTGQASSLASLLNVRTLILLRCEPDTVLQRIENNSGGDRTHRTDDQKQAVKQKLELYVQRTVPLVEHYQGLGASVIPLGVSATMTATQMWQLLEKART